MLLRLAAVRNSYRGAIAVSWIDTCFDTKKTYWWLQYLGSQIPRWRILSDGCYVDGRTWFGSFIFQPCPVVCRAECSKQEILSESNVELSHAHWLENWQWMVLVKLTVSKSFCGNCHSSLLVDFRNNALAPSVVGPLHPHDWIQNVCF